MRSDSLSGSMIAAYLAPTLHLTRKGGGSFLPTLEAHKLDGDQLRVPVQKAGLSCVPIFRD